MKLPLDGYIASPASGPKFSSTGLLFWIYVSLVFAVFSSCTNGCEFPRYTLNNVNGTVDARDWRGRIKDQNKETNLK